MADTLGPPQFILDLGERAINSESRDIREDAVCELTQVMGEMYKAIVKLRLKFVKAAVLSGTDEEFALISVADVDAALAKAHGIGNQQTTEIR